LVAFCPDCFRIHQIANPERRELRCCASRFKLDQGTFCKGQFICRHCGQVATHRQLRTGIAPRRLLAIEETSDGSRRRLRAPKKADFEQINASAEYLAANKDALRLPDYAFVTDRLDDRPLSFGISRAVELFTDRQLVVFGTAFAYLDTKTLLPSVERALRLALSNALTTNNKLCSYAIDYGRLAPLFSVRSYSLPWLAVELNPFHPNAGRGTLAKAFKKILGQRSLVLDDTHGLLKRRKLSRKITRFPGLAETLTSGVHPR
jgi:putative DNA methylase